MSSFYIGKWEDKGEPFSIPGFWEVEHSEMAPTWWPHNSAKPSWLYRDEVSCICRRGKMWEKCYSFNNNSKDFPGGPMVKILPSNAGGVDSIPGLGAKILHALPPPSPSGREGNGTPVLLPGESRGRRSLVGCSPWGRYESDTTERLHFHFSLSCTGERNGSPLQCSCLENPRDGRPGGLPSMGSHRVGHDWSDLAAAAAAVTQWTWVGFSFWQPNHPQL